MNGMRAVAMGILASSALTCGAFVVAQQTQKRSMPPGGALSRLSLSETPRESHLTGLKVVRLINTAEMNYKEAHGSYATWDELIPSGAISEREKPRTMFQGLRLSVRPEVTPGWVLDLVTAANGQGYELSLRNLPDKCGFSFFSDQRGIIYQGGWIDCSVELKPSGN
ncbi:MAG TPA: hypothetical protein VGS59_11015 [Candidatus Acidoferrales bacterium]|nr:hypothetical protein [Candidatus Acidoferrales bacterium]